MSSQVCRQTLSHHLDPTQALQMNSTPFLLTGPLLDWPVHGRNLRGETLGENLEPQRTLVVFLRHFG